MRNHLLRQIKEASISLENYVVIRKTKYRSALEATETHQFTAKLQTKIIITPQATKLNAY